MNNKKAFVYSEVYFDFDYGPHHPMRVERLKLAYDLIQAYGLLELPDIMVCKTEPAGLSDLYSFHRPEYLEVIRRCSQGYEDPDEASCWGLGAGDNPVFNGMWEWSLLTTGASLMCGRMVADGLVGTAFNIAGGLHHAMKQRASGFCYVNDIVVTINELVARGLRVAYLDVDAHHGDGVQEAFLATDQVLTISLHQHGRTLFPGTGFVFETGTGRGQGFCVNIPFHPGVDDELYVDVFKALVPDLIEAYQPDILVTQLGVDTFRTDPLTNMCLTTNGFMAVLEMIKGFNLPWVALGGGGYHIVNVARAWTLAWALINGIDPPDELPVSFIKQITMQGYREQRLRDEPYRSQGHRREEVQITSRQVIDTIRQTILPVVAKCQKSVITGGRFPESGSRTVGVSPR